VLRELDVGEELRGAFHESDRTHAARVA
jgi:hypothetical protein